MSDIVLLIDRLYCIDLFSCIAASLINKLTYLLTYLLPLLQRANGTDGRTPYRYIDPAAYYVSSTCQ